MGTCPVLLMKACTFLSHARSTSSPISVQFGKLSLIIGILNTARRSPSPKDMATPYCASHHRYHQNVHIGRTFARRASGTNLLIMFPHGSQCRNRCLSARCTFCRRIPAADSRRILCSYCSINAFYNFPAEVFHLLGFTSFQGLIDGYSPRVRGSCGIIHSRSPHVYWLR